MGIVFMRKLKWLVWFVTVFLLGACGGADELPTAVPPVIIPTPLPTTEAAPAEPTAVPTSTSPASEPEQLPTHTATAVPPTNTPEPTAIPPTPTATVQSSTNVPSQFSVIYVEPNDVLNVRSGPGVAFGIVGTISSSATDVQITGSGQIISGSTWVPIQRGALTGWVNSRFLTANMTDAAFCGSTAVSQLLAQFETAVATQNDILLSQLIHPERGLRVRLLWHEAETRLDNQNLLSDGTVYNWGNAAGSGEPIVGTTAQVLLPRLENDFLGATDTACNDILSGPTAGFVILPDAYEPISYYTYFRPGTAEFDGLNWGSWVVGVELWQGSYYLNTLVHYQWEP